MQVFISVPFDKFSGVPARQIEILRRMGVGLYEAMNEIILKADFVIDALLGYSFRGAPSGITASLIRQANTSGAFPRRSQRSRCDDRQSS